MTDEWPKTWNEIYHNDDVDNHSGRVRVMKQYANFCDAIRTYDGTLYANVDSDEEGDNRDLWLPFGLYIERLMEEQGER